MEWKDDNGTTGWFLDPTPALLVAKLVYVVAENIIIE